MKAKIKAIIPKETKQGAKFYNVITDENKEYSCWSSRIVGKEGEEVEFEEKPTQYGVMMVLPKGEYQGKGRWIPQKSVEEIEGQKQTMLYAYAKDLVVALIGAGVIKSTVDASKWYLDIFQDSYGKIAGKKEPQEETIKEPF